MLPDVFPAARILGFGWDIGSRTVEASPNFGSTASEIISKLTALRKGYLQRAIVFIGHGYGNVLIANILAGEGQLTQERANLMSLTAAVVLFAAPLFDYTGLIEWTSKASKISRGSKFFSSPIPPQLWENLSSYTKKEKIFTFAFLERDAACLHVDEQEDARTTKSAERLKQLEILDTVETKENISNVAKFTGPEDQRWELIRSRIHNVVRTHQLLDVARDTGTERLERLIKNSFDLNLSNKDGQTALQMAAKHQRPGAVKLLLGTGKVDINHQDIFGMTALHTAVVCNSSNSVEIVHDLFSRAVHRRIYSFFTALRARSFIHIYTKTPHIPLPQLVQVVTPIVFRSKLGSKK
jgi:Ankyrin repeats (3 copies)